MKFLSTQLGTGIRVSASVKRSLNGIHDLHTLTQLLDPSDLLWIEHSSIS